MYLVPHKITALAESDADGTDGKNIVAGAVVILYDKDDNAIFLYDDANGSNPSTSKVTDTQGQVVVWVTQGEYEEEVNGATRRKVNVGGVSPSVIDTFSNLELLNPTQDGQEFVCQERDNASYTLQPSGYVALFGDVTFANGRIAAINAGKEFVLKQFGAKEDYNYSADSGTDDLSIINSVLARASSSTDKNTTVVVTDKSLVSGPVVIPEGVTLKGVKKPSGGANQVGSPTWPLGVDTGSSIISSSLTGPVVLVNRGDIHIEDLDLGSTQDRYNATISTGAQNTNSGLVVETDDTSNSSLRRFVIKNVVCRNQPAEGFYVAGNIVTGHFEDTVSLNCNRHGIAFDNGALSGRANTFRPGIISVQHHRSVNTGGHGLVIGDPNSEANVPFRIYLNEYEGFRGGNIPAELYQSSGSYIRGTDIVVMSSASSGTSGTSGNTATLSHAYAVSGRSIHIIGCRYINYTAEPLLIFGATGLSNLGLKFSGVTASTNAAEPVNFASVTATIQGLIADSFNNTGFTGDPFDLSSFTSNTVNVEISYIDRAYSYNKKFDVLESAAFTSVTETISDNGFIYIPLVGTNVNGAIQVCGSTNNAGSAKVHFRAGSANFATLVDSSGATVGVDTVALNGTTGPDGELTISSTSDGLYIENRTGSNAQYSIALLGVNFANGSLDILSV